MAKHDVDPVLAQLVRSVNDSGEAAVPVTLFLNGAAVHGMLIPADAYFADLARRFPLMSALQPGSGLLGKEYVKEVEAETGHYLHLRADGLPGDPRAEDGLWRVSLDSVDGWTFRAVAGAGTQDDRGPFARLLGTS
jgi:hypothetical protein